MAKHDGWDISYVWIDVDEFEVWDYHGNVLETRSVYDLLEKNYGLTEDEDEKVFVEFLKDTVEDKDKAIYMLPDGCYILYCLGEDIVVVAHDGYIHQVASDFEHLKEVYAEKCIFEVELNRPNYEDDDEEEESDEDDEGDDAEEDDED